MPSPAAIIAGPTPKRTALPRRSPIARRGVSIGALSGRRGKPGAMRAGDLAPEGR